MTLPRRVVPGRAVRMWRRTLRRHFLFRPDRKLNQLFLYLVGVVTQMFGVKLNAIQVLSDHVPAVVTDERTSAI